MTNPFNCGVYRWFNTSSEKSYIGSSNDLRHRKMLHTSQLGRGKHHSIKLQRSWDKHGTEVFEFEVLVYCAEADLLHFEQMAIEAFDSQKQGYNVLPKAGTSRGWKASSATCQKRSAVTRDLWKCESFRNKQRESRLQAWQSIERHEAQSKMASARKHTDVVRAKIAESQRDRLFSVDTRGKMKAAWSPERREAQAERMRTLRRGK